MLTFHLSRFSGPAAASCRRSLLAAVTLVALAGCAAPPTPPDLEGARAAAVRAARAVRPVDERRAEYIETLINLADVATYQEFNASRWNPQTGRAAAAWLRVAIAAREASALARRHTSRARAAYDDAYGPTRIAVLRARSEIRETGMGAQAAAAMARANVLLETASRLAAGGDYPGARQALDRAHTATETIHDTWLALHSRFSSTTLRRQWRRWVELTLQESRRTRSTAIIVDKLNRRLEVYYRGLRLTTFPAELGANGLRRKEHAGDRATPEGMYRVTELKEGRKTRYYKALLINYPNDEDKARFDRNKRRGIIPGRAGIGGLIEIHGGGGEGLDWTDGCVALRNEDMDYIYPRVQVGTLVTIVGRHER